MAKAFFGAIALLAAVTSASAAISTVEARRLDGAARIVQETRADIPESYWTTARCVAVIPDLKKAAFIFGGEYGKGVMSCRAGDEWSAPVFIELAKGSWGFQAGVEEVDLVLLVMNERGVQKLLQNKTTLGADASVAAGPIGRRGAVGTDAQMRAEILSYSRSHGLFAGIDLSGGILRPDEDANTDVYGRGAESRTVLASRELSAPPEARTFLRALSTASAADAAGAPRATTTSVQGSAAASTPATPRTTTMTTTDDDLRARVVDIQQTLDRLLADTTPAPVGTTGTAAGTTTDAAANQSRTGTVAVERARLLQLRAQLDQLLAALNRR
jgi:SH3 domain-containing YSC84-like protein 1